MENSLQMKSPTFNTSLVGCDGGTLDAYIIFPDGLGGVNGNLVVGLVPVRQTQVIVLAVNFQVGEDQLQQTSVLIQGAISH